MLLLTLLPHPPSPLPLPFRFGAVHGEDMAYVLGMPLVGGTYHFVHNYTNQANKYI